MLKSFRILITLPWTFSTEKNKPKEKKKNYKQRAGKVSKFSPKKLTSKVDRRDQKNIESGAKSLPYGTK